MIAGPHPWYGWDFPEEIPERLRKDAGNALRAFPGSFPSRVRLGCPKPYNSRHLRLPEQNSRILSPPVRLGALLFSEVVPERASQLPEPVMEFPAVLGVFLNCAVFPMNLVLEGRVSFIRWNKEESHQHGKELSSAESRVWKLNPIFFSDFSGAPGDILGTHRIGANPEKSDLVNSRGPGRRRCGELCLLLFFS